MSISCRLIVFDWEGTLGDSLGPILNVIAMQADSIGLPVIDKAYMARFVHLGLVRALERIYPEASSHEVELLQTAVQKALTHRQCNALLFPGAAELVRALHEKNILLAIATNKGQASLQRCLEASGLDKYFTITRSAGQVPPKPSPQMLEEIMLHTGVNASEAIMIGDSPTDMEMASSLQVTGVGLDLYHQAAQSLYDAGAVEVFDSYSQLTHYLEDNLVL